MASWSIHSYPAPRVEDAVEDADSDTHYPIILGQPNREQPAEGIAPLWIQTTNVMRRMPGPMSPPAQYTPPMSVDTTVTRDVQLPSFADLQHSLMLLDLPPPSFMGHLLPTRLPPSRVGSNVNQDLHHSMYPVLRSPSPTFTSTPDFNSGSDSGAYVDPHYGFNSESEHNSGSNSDSESTFETESESEPDEPSSHLYESMFNYWLLAVRPRRYVFFLCNI